jgi:hypothetical protein
LLDSNLPITGSATTFAAWRMPDQQNAPDAGDLVLQLRTRQLTQSSGSTNVTVKSTKDEDQVVRHVRQHEAAYPCAGSPGRRRPHTSDQAFDERPSRELRARCWDQFDDPPVHVEPPVVEN